MAKQTKKFFRVIGITQTRNMETFARNLERAMNGLKDDGYSFQMHERPQGIALIGALQDKPEEDQQEGKGVEGHIAVMPFGRLMSMLRGEPELSPRTRELFIRFRRAAGENGNVEKMKEQAAACTSGFTTEELKVAITEISKALDQHVQESGCGGECQHSKPVKAMVEILKGAMHLALQ